MKRFEEARVEIKMFPFLCVLILFVVSAAPAFGQTCVPVIGNPVNVNGIIAGAGTVPGSCTVDPGWAGSIGRNFVPYGVPGGPKVAKMFFAGYRAGAAANLDTVYLGVHFEGDPDLQAQDRIVFYFDANGNNTWDSPDFALLYEIGSLTPPSTEECNKSAGTGQLFRYIDGQWVSQGAIPAGITTKVSWDYDPISDPETGIWELELGINVSVMGLNAPANGNGFKVGAKMYVYEAGVSGWSMWHFPAANLTTSDDPLLFDPQEGGVTPDKLAQVAIGTCGYEIAFEPDATTGVTATSNNGEVSKFTRLDVNSSADFNQTTGNAIRKNHFEGRIKFFDPADPINNSPVAAPNTGHLKYWIKPYNAGFLGEYLMKDQVVSFTHLNETYALSFDWPQTKAQYAPAQSDLNNSDHTCLKVQIDGFTIDTDTSNNLVNRNLVYTSLSTVRDSFVIGTVDKGEPPAGMKEFEYIFHASWSNVPTKAIDMKNVIGNTKPAKGKWNYKFINARQIGLRDLGKGYFSVMLKPGQTKRVKIAITGGEMPVKTMQLKLSPRAGGMMAVRKPSGEASLKLDVKPGSIVTIIANGTITMGSNLKQTVGPNGFSDKERMKQDFLLHSHYYKPWENIGALIASVDEFKTAFVIGSDKTFVMPEGSDKLLLAVNDLVGEFDNNDGKGFEINVAISEPEHLPTKLVAQANPKLGVPAQVRAGSNLPELDIEVFNAVPLKRTRQRLLKPTGYVAYAVYASHLEQ